MAHPLLMIDGSMGEGGGQVLRSSLALSMITGVPFHIFNLRANRAKPGLLRQHLTAVNAAATISRAEVKGNTIGSRELTFTPHSITPGHYHFPVGTAGSATLVLQTVLPPLITADRSSTLALEGGTHNPYAPPFDFLEKAFLPCLHKMGPKVSCVLDRPGYYPAGGGRFSVKIEPVKRLHPIEIIDRGKFLSRHARAVVSRLSPRIGERELEVMRRMLGWEDAALELVEEHRAVGPGNVLIAELRFENITEIFTGFGERGVHAERVAMKTAQEVSSYLASDAPVGRYLADQLVLLMGIAGKGTFRTMPPTEHTLTNIEVVKIFLGTDIRCEEIGEKVWEIRVG